MYLHFTSFGIISPLTYFRASPWFSSKESACQCRRHGFEPWIGKIPWRRKWQPTAVFLPGKSHEQRILAGFSSWDQKRISHDIGLNNNIFYFILKNKFWKILNYNYSNIITNTIMLCISLESVFLFLIMYYKSGLFLFFPSPWISFNHLL